MGGKKKKGTGEGVLANNRKAFHDYEVLDRIEAGIQLVGTEVKSCRAAKISMVDAYADITDGQAWMHGVYIAPYEFGNRNNHKDVRVRRLLLHKIELLRWSQKVREKGFTIIPLKMYLKQGLVKVQLGLCKGKNVVDKRDTLRKRQDDMDTRRAVKRL